MGAPQKQSEAAVNPHIETLLHKGIYFLLSIKLPSEMEELSSHETDTYDVSDTDSSALEWDILNYHLVVEETVLSEHEFCSHIEEFP